MLLSGMTPVSFNNTAFLFIAIRTAILEITKIF